MEQKNFYITTPLYYLNGAPHVGNSYSTIASDVIARWHRLRGEKVFFLTGTDEHGEKVLEAAKRKDIGVKMLVDKMSAIFKNTWDSLDISYDDFIRTTEERHKEVVKELIVEIDKKGDIYKGNYKGKYCVGCESFKTDSDLKDGKCTEHNKEPEVREEETYFFKLSKYQKELLEFYEKNPEFLSVNQSEEIKNRVKEGLKDLSITRSNLSWGIPFPLDECHVTYVWFDALINYISALGGKKGGLFKEFWPADVHIIGREINWFHSVIWPAILFSVGIKPPKKIFVNGWFLVEGQKISKSLGNAIDPLEMTRKYSTDSLRYYLLKETTFGEDGNFSEKKLIERINGELVADLGNLVYRALTLAEKADKIEGKPFENLNERIEKIDGMMEKFQIRQSLEEIWKIVRDTNKYINDTEPWKLSGKELGNVVYNLMERIRIIAILLSPFLPSTSERIFKQLNVESGKLKDCKFRQFTSKPEKGDYIFNKVDV